MERHRVGGGTDPGANLSKASILFLCVILVLSFSAGETHAATWDSEEEISTDVTREKQTYPSIAAEGDNLYVVWADEGDGDKDIYYRHFDGASWQPEIEISTDVEAENQINPSIAVDDGKVHVVWADWGGGFDIYYRFFDGTTWQPEEEISTGVGSYTQLHPSMAVQSDEVHIVWESWQDVGGDDRDVYYRHFDGASWQPEIEISTDLVSEMQTNPSIAVYDDEVHITWVDGGIGDDDILYRHFDGTTWHSEVQVSTDLEAENQMSPMVAVNGSKVHFVWLDTEDGDGDVYYRYLDGFTWWSELEISRDSGTGWQSHPSISVEGEKVYIVWQDKGGEKWDIHYRYFDGVDWKREQKISTGRTAHDETSVAVDAGNVHVVWVDYTDNDGDIYYRRGIERDEMLTEDHTWVILVATIVVVVAIVILLTWKLRKKPQVEGGNFGDTKRF